MEKKRKHPNFIDIAFVVLIAAVALAAYFLSHSSTEAAAETVKRSYVVELTQLDTDMAGSVAVGDSVTDNVKNYDLGTVTAVEVIPYTTSALDEAAGLYHMSEVPGKITLLVTIEADTTETASEINTVSGHPLRIGTSVSCSVGSLTAAGYIIELDR